MKVLVSAYACEPLKGSESAVGWNWVNNIAKFSSVTVITRSNNRNSIENSATQQSNLDIKWLYYDLPRLISFWKRKQRGVQLYYYLWQIGIFFLVKKQIKKEQYDIIHHLTFAKYWAPSFLGFLKVPFIFGPVGGGDTTPFVFLHNFSFHGKIYEISRLLAKSLAELDIFVKQTIKKSDLVFASTETTAQKLYKMGAKRIIIETQVALTVEQYSLLSNLVRYQHQPIRFLSAGSLLALKGFDLTIHAFAQFCQEYVNDAEYWIAGDGPEFGKLQKLVNQYALQNRIRFLGKLQQQHLWQIFQKSSILLHPSFHDSGGFVVLESMAAGVPVIFHNFGGPAMLVPDQAGLRIDSKNYKTSVLKFKNAMLKLARDKELLFNMGENARIAAKNHIIDKKMAILQKYYSEICQH